MTCVTCWHDSVFCPYPIEDCKKPVSSFRQGLVLIEGDHCDHRVALFFDDHGILLSANPAEQRGELVLGILSVTGLYHWISSVMAILRLSLHRVHMRIQGKFCTSPQPRRSAFPITSHDSVHSADATTWHLLRRGLPPCYGILVSVEAEEATVRMWSNKSYTKLTA
jgi:hypothetical protein